MVALTLLLGACTGAEQAPRKVDASEAAAPMPEVAPELAPDKVCDHMIAISLLARAGQPAPPKSEVEQVHSDCMSTAKRELLADQAAYESKARCVLTTKTIAESMKCEPDK